MVQKTTHSSPPVSRHSFTRLQFYVAAVERNYNFLHFLLRSDVFSLDAIPARLCHASQLLQLQASLYSQLKVLRSQFGDGKKGAKLHVHKRAHVPECYDGEADAGRPVRLKQRVHKWCHGTCG